MYKGRIPRPNTNQELPMKYMLIHRPDESLASGPDDNCQMPGTAAARALETWLSDLTARGVLLDGARLRPGTPVAIEGPYGVFTRHAQVRPLALLIAAGIGVTRSTQYDDSRGVSSGTGAMTRWRSMTRLAMTIMARYVRASGRPMS